MPITIVYELGTDNKYTYTLPAKHAVVCAWYQVHCHNSNTWQYDMDHPLLHKGKHGWHMGDFSALFDKEEADA